MRTVAQAGIDTEGITVSLERGNFNHPILGRLFAFLMVAAGVSSASGSALVFTDASPQALTDATGGAGAHTTATTISNLAVSIPGSFGEVRDLDVKVRVSHSNVRQLRIILEAPDGETATLLENGITTSGNLIIGARSASGANLESTVFDADTYYSILDGDSPYTGRFQAEELGTIDNRTAAQASGTWKLRITDYRAGDTGSLLTWSLTFKSGTTQTFTVTNLNDSGPGSLRSAVTAANSNAGVDNYIRFDPSLTGGTINLTTGPIEIVGGTLFYPIDIQLGNDSRNFTIRNSGNSRVFIISAGQAILRNMTIAEGIATGVEGGGAIFNAGRLFVDRCTIRNNSSNYAGGTARGGGIANVGELRLDGSTLTGNVSQSGGAIHTSGGQTSLYFCTLSGNFALNAGAGSGGAVHAASGSLTCAQSTISGNSADGMGGGITNRPASTAALHSNIVAKNNAPAGPDLHGNFSSVFYCLVGNTSDSNFSNNTNKTGTNASPLDPFLGPLQNNGGNTDTMALLFGSPAIDSGSIFVPQGQDQRGIRRPVDFASVPNAVEGHDMGAFELSPAVFANISTRLQVETGENVLIAGFIVTTPTSDTTTKVLLRGLGLSLQASGITGTLNNPLLELHNSGGLLVLNDNWRDSQPQEIEATTIPPPNDLESAIVRTLELGPHTAILRGKDATTGVGLVELYDLDLTSSAMVANISTRGFVQGGDKVMIAGFILSGPDPARILLRAIGPSLAAAGIGQPLADPFLELFDGQGVKITENNNWQDTQGPAIVATGAAPSNATESAILIDLTPGNYTAVMRGVGGSVGVGVVEAYNIR